MQAFLGYEWFSRIETKLYDKSKDQAGHLKHKSDNFTFTAPLLSKKIKINK